MRIDDDNGFKGEASRRWSVCVLLSRSGLARVRLNQRRFAFGVA
jgi:hypothetical protein